MLLFFRLAGLTDLVRGQQLLAVLLKLLDFTMKVKVNRQRMIEPSMQALNIMLAVLNRVSNKMTQSCELLFGFHHESESE